MRRRAGLVTAATAALLAASTASTLAEQHPPVFAARPLSLEVAGENGAGLIDRPGRPCADGGNGAHFHYGYTSGLAAGAFGKVPGDLRLHLDLHSEAQGAPQPTYTKAFLLGGESSAAVSNERGTLRLALRSGEGQCATPNLAFDGSALTAPATGTWTVAEATGSYRQATAGPGPNTFELGTAEVAPGADNRFRLKLAGSVNVLQPALTVKVKETYWGFLGIDYLLRRVTVVYEITNTGHGDAYGVRLKDVSATPGVDVLGPKEQKLGDLAAGETEEARVKFHLRLGNPPCEEVILDCEFGSTLTVVAPDALDHETVHQRSVTARAPDLPPPLL